MFLLLGKKDWKFEKIHKCNVVYRVMVFLKCVAQR